MTALNELWNTIFDDGSGLEDEVLNDLTRTFREQQDWQIISTSLIDRGYVKVDIGNCGYIPTDFEAIKIWADANIQGSYRNYRDEWVFQRASDAVQFRLKWA